MSTSMVAVGASLRPLLSLACFLSGALTALLENAEDKTSTIFAAFHIVVMLSGKAASSMMNTSEEDRRPRTEADSMSSRLRISPRPSALP